MAGWIKWIWGGWFFIGVMVCPMILAAQPVPGSAFPEKAHQVPGASSGAIVSPSAPAPMTDIHDIKPLASVPVPGVIPQWAWIALSGALVVVLLVAAWMYWRRKNRSEKPGAVAPPRPIEELAYEGLNGLIADTRLTEKQFYFQLSAILRAYLGGRFDMDAMEMTTEEIVPAVEQLPMERGLKTGIRDFSQFSDPVKFADVSPPSTRREHYLAFVRELVQKTTPEVVEKEG